MFIHIEIYDLRSEMKHSLFSPGLCSKTWSVCMFDCGMLTTVPGFIINVYSTGRRASKMLKEQVEQFIHMTGEENFRKIIQSNQEELFIAHKNLTMDNNRRSVEAITLRDDPTTSKLLSYPSSKKGKGNEIPKNTRTDKKFRSLPPKSLTCQTHTFHFL